MIRHFIISTSLLALLAACGSEPGNNETSAVPTETASVAPLPAAPTEVPVAKVEPPKELPTLYGQWIPDESKCPGKGELSDIVMTITRDRVDRYESYCSAKPAIPRKGQYNGKLACAAEGEEFQVGVTLSVNDDGKLQYESDGSATTWKRCPWRLQVP
ncbi:hypothetical protein GCM10011617_29990 [Novosphingobium arvoryzae]|uniref:Lipoprotein n=1 Tax=Novosphingobium arvoryzae TaxID=1256514 RepID=A0A918RSY5_9SPHN|nr:hypothetical protein GCM10011617_29990 [Novosphingobium arvoryzae]